MHTRFREVLRATGVPWIEVRGDHDRRMAQATAAIDELVARPRELSAPLPEAHVGLSTPGVLTDPEETP